MKKNKKKKEESIEDVKQKYPFADEMLTTIRQEYETENGEYPKVCVNLQTDVR